MLGNGVITPLEEEGPPFLPPVSMESILISAPGTCLSVIKWAHLVFLGACVTGAVKRNEGHKEGASLLPGSQCLRGAGSWVG